MRRRKRERGALLGIVLIMLMVLMAASVFAFFSLRTDSGAAAQDRLSHQLFDCAEQGLQIGKMLFTSSTAQSSWGAYFKANAPGTTLTSGLALPTDHGIPMASPPVPQPGYPLEYCAGCANPAITLTLGLPAQNTQLTLNRAIAIYNNPGESATPLDDSDHQAVLWSACMEPNSKQMRSLQTLISATPVKNGNYFGQAGFGYNNSGNTNNTPK
jgi:hypothetical protein